MKPILFYSGGCRFCRWAARMIVRLDSKHELCVLPTRSVYAKRYLWRVPEPQRYQSWWLLLPNGSLFSGGLGIVFLLRSLTVTRWLGEILSRSVVIDALDRFDQWLKAHRHWFAPVVPNDYAPFVYPESVLTIYEREKAA